ncbi:MAG TPA: hypothetical protein VME92_20695 [Acetobacteraceae bacterium]|nr:hypothetical protein [Acetobacteraceae bacterium]
MTDAASRRRRSIPGFLLWIVAPVALACVTAGHGAFAQTLYRARGNTIGCVNPRATQALTSNDPRRYDPNWVAYVMSDGRCARITPASRWTLLARSGGTVLMRNVVPGTGAEFYVPRWAMAALAPNPPHAAVAAPRPSELPPIPEYWDPAGTAAAAFTGIVTFKPDTITFENGQSLPLSPDGTVPYADEGGRGVASIYRVTPPADPPLLNGDKLCSGRGIAFLLVRHMNSFGDKMVQLNAFAGPNFGKDAKDGCGRLAYFPSTAAAEAAHRVARTSGPDDHDGGQYCKTGYSHSYDMLLVRVDQDGKLAFGFEELTGAGNSMSVAGVASVAPGGWEYRENINAPDPDQRCQLDFSRNATGDWTISTADGARCESYAGHGAGLYGSDAFPAHSRVGPAPAKVDMDALNHLGC